MLPQARPSCEYGVGAGRHQSKKSPYCATCAYQHGFENVVIVPCTAVDDGHLQMRRSQDKEFSAKKGGPKAALMLSENNQKALNLASFDSCEQRLSRFIFVATLLDQLLILSRHQTGFVFPLGV